MSEPESRRWLVLSCMFWLGLMQAVGWVTYSANPQIASEYYGFENAKASIDMLLNWGPIMYLPVAPLVGYLIAKNADHLWHVILSGAVLTATGMVLRLMPNILGLRVTSHAAHACVHLGQALNGAAGPMNCVTPSALAALWFPSHQRAVATSVVFAIQMAGPPIGFLFGLRISSSSDLVMLMAIEAGFALAVVVAWAFLPSKPKVPPSNSQELRATAQSVERRSASPVSLQRWASTTFLVLSGSFVIGVFQCWSPALPTQLQGVLPEALLKWLVIISASASVFGNFAAPPLIEAWGLQWRLKMALAVMLLVQLVAFGIFTASLPDSPVPLSGAVTSSPSWLIAWLVVASVAEGAMAPMVYELSAELTYPHSEGVTGAAFSWLLNFWGFLLLWIFPLVPSRYDSLMMTGTCIVSLLLLAVVHAEYPRRRLDETDCQTTELLPSTGA
ncbi:unnamed protein product [Durusdinium trenchii]|uniref:Uncharacterized protein n=1 Tax=Durusdinium trenchii TaxID=1381693 RepID=A0ABP0REB9_9DINO